MIRVCTIRRVPVFVHWSVPAACLFFLGVGWRSIIVMAAAIAGYLAMLLIHELGHQIAAQMRHYRVVTVEIYPLHGICRSEAPPHGSDGAFIAAAGPLAQFIVAAPIVLLVYTFGYPPFAWLAVFVAVVGFASPMIAALNLLPIRPLDGSRAWQLLRVRRRPRVREETALEAFERARREALRKT